MNSIRLHVHRLLLPSLALACAPWAAGPASAQSPPASDTRTRATGALEEITVTARKFEERLSEAPLAVSAFSGDALAEAGVRDIVDIARLTPGFAMQDASRQNDTPFIRGMSVNSAFRNQQHASSFIDGVFVQGLSRTLDFNTEIQRIEVIRGPQSALFGRATFSGAINYITRLPANEFGGEVVTSVGEHGLLDASANLTGPIIDGKLQFRVNGQIHRYDGQWRNTLDGAKVGSEETNGGSAMLRFTPLESLEFIVRASKAKFDDGHPATVIVGSAANNCQLGGVRAFLCGEVPVPDAVSLNLAQVDGGFRRTDQTRSYLKINWDTPLGQLASTTSYNDERFDYYIDGDGTGLAAAGGAFHSYFYEDLRDRSQELRFTFDMPERWRLLAGLYWFKGEYGIGQYRPTVVAPNPREDENRSVFASVTYDLLDSLSISVDGRYQEDRVSTYNPAGARTNQQTTNNFLPRVILDWKPTPAQTWYASASKGSRPASFNTVAGTPPDLINVKEQEIWSYEIGNRTQWLDNRASTAVAVYYIDWDNQTTQQPINIPGPPPRLITVSANVGKTRIRGAEFEGTWLPWAPLELRATYSYNNAEFLDFLSDVCLAVLGTRQCAGQKLQNTPHQQGSFSAAFRQPIGDRWRWISRADLTWRSSMPMSEVNSARSPGFTLLNLRTGIEAGSWNVTLWLNNVTDEDSPAFATRFSDLNNLPQYGYQLTLRRGREGGVTASVRF